MEGERGAEAAEPWRAAFDEALDVPLAARGTFRV
jgi:hypothetical protein